MELICINDIYDSKTIEAFSKYSIKYPKEGEIVELLRVDKLKLRGKIGLIIAPYQNQWIKDGDFEKEVSFNHTRFCRLNKDSISIEEIIEWSKKTEKDFVKVKKK